MVEAEGDRVAFGACNIVLKLKCHIDELIEVPVTVTGTSIMTRRRQHILRLQEVLVQARGRDQVGHCSLDGHIGTRNSG